MTTELKHKTAAAIEFLRWLRPAGPWSLVALVPDGKDNGATFTAGQQEKMRKWIEERQGKQNIYYQLNPTITPTTTTATKANTARIEFLHVDVDPRAGEDFEEERARIKSLLMERIGEMLPATPELSAVIDSGGGYQGLFRLTPSPLLEVNGDVSKAEELECYTRQLETLFGCDHTHNVNRILRLPGTVNLPTAKKRKNGRKPALAELIDFNDNAYSLDLFKAAPPKAETITAGTPTASRTASPRAAVGDGTASPNEWQGKWSIADATIPPTVGTAELTAWANANGKTIDDWALALVTTGDASKYDGDRSNMVFAVTCHLARVGAPKELIAGLLLDPNNTAFYEHVSAQKGNKRRYVERQVNRAYAEVAKGDGTAGTLPGGEVLTWDRMNQNGEPLPSYWNTRTALLLMGVECRYDKFRDRHLIGSHELDEYAGDFSDHAERILRDAIIRRFGFDPGEVNPRNAVLSLCTENRFDSLLDHLHALPPWDGTPRLDTWLVDYLGAEDNAYTREAGAAWLSAAIVRAFEPGAKFDQMLVLEGATGLGKSTALRVLATGTLDLTCADRFSDASFLGARDAREVLEVTAGVWILECAELDGMSRKEVETLKAAITRQEDKGRLAYARTAVTVPRRFVLAGTTNEDRYLHDPTGNRRFWPVRVVRGNLEGLAAVRDQLVAEALARYRSDSHRLLLSPEAEALAKQEQDRRRVVDEGFVESLHDLSACLQRGTGQWAGRWIVTNDAVYGHLGLTRDKRVGKVPRMVKTAMQALGWKKVPQTVKVDGKPSNIFVWEGEGEPGKPESEDATAGGDGHRPPF